jgi:hypothetical protein
MSGFNLIDFIFENAEYTDDEKGQLLATIRFCHTSVREDLQPIRTEQFTDEFYDQVVSEHEPENAANMLHGRSDCYIRDRDGTTVKQKSPKSNHGDMVHYYLQTTLDRVPEGLTKIVSYKFLRYTYFENDTVSLYKDVITEPVPYSVTTLKLRVASGVNSTQEYIRNHWKKCLELDFVSKYLQIMNFRAKNCGLPVTFSKFMYILQLSRFRRYYFDVFVKYDTTSPSIVKRNVEFIYNEDQSTVDSYKEYLWVTASLNYFQTLLEYRKYTVEQAHEVLKEEYRIILSEESPFDSKQEVDVF